MEFTSPTLIDSAVPSGQQIVNYRELSVGAGSDIFKANKDGVFIGAVKYADAPFKVNYQGVMTASAGTFSGTVNVAASGGSGIIIDNTGTIKFSYNGVQYATAKVDSSTNLILASNTNFQFFDSSSNQVAVLNSSGLDLMDNAYLKFRNGSKLTDTGAYAKFDRTLGVAGDVFLDAGNKFQIGTTGGVSVSHANIGGLFAITTVGGIVTSFTKF